MEYYETEAQLIEEFVDALGEIPDAHADIKEREVGMGGNYRIDGLVELSVAGKPHILLVEAKRSVYPRDVRQVIWQMDEYRQAASSAEIKNATPFLIAYALSPGAREVLREHKIGYYDRGGSLYSPISGAYVYIDKPSPKPMKKEFVSVFKGARARVLKALFVKGREWTNVKEITKISKVSSATVSQTLQELERREWLRSDGSGPAKMRRLGNAGALLDAWVHFLEGEKPPKYRRFYVPISDSEKMMEHVHLAFRRQNIIYAFTGEIAANAYSPYLTQVSQVHCRVSSSNHEHEALLDLDAKPVSEGWNLALLDSPASDFIGVEKREGIRIASPLQVYLDLVHGKGRSKEMAEHLRHERLDI